MARTERLKRLRAELWLLEEAPDGLTAKELSTKLDVSARTVQRDLVELRVSGYPLSSVGARWRFIAGIPLPTTLAADGASEAPAHDRAQIVDRAIQRRHPIDVEYWPFSGDSPLHLRIAPLALRYLEGSLFVVAREWPNGRLRTFALERLARPRVIRRKYKLERPGRLERYLDEHFSTAAAKELTKIVVSFSPSAVWVVTERTWHPSQRVTLEDDGTALVSLRVPGFAWVEAWVLGFGSKALVLEPRELIWRVFAELDRARKRYEDHTNKLPQLDLFEQRK